MTILLWSNPSVFKVNVFIQLMRLDKLLSLLLGLVGPLEFGEQVGDHEDEECSHHYEHRAIEGERSCQIAGEAIVTPLDNRNFGLLI